MDILEASFTKYCFCQWVYHSFSAHTAPDVGRDTEIKDMSHLASKELIDFFSLRNKIS
jgi:hypothetical protein